MSASGDRPTSGDYLPLDQPVPDVPPTPIPRSEAVPLAGRDPLVRIRATHPYGFRRGVWGMIRGIVWVSGRPCFDIAWPDGACDRWPIVDPHDAYEYESAGNDA